MYSTASENAVGHAPDHSHDILRPFMWVGMLSFLTGFLGYLALFMPTVQG